jgi:hypothetical protein
MNLGLTDCTILLHPDGDQYAVTLLERISTPGHSPTIDTRLVNAMRGVPHAVGLAIAHYPSGTHGILVIDAPGSVFLDSEEVAMERLLEVRREFVDSAIDVLCLPAGEADRLDVPPDVQIYAYA